MHYTKQLFIALVFVSSIGFAQQKKQYKVNTIAFYNVENLFDTENDPITYDDDRTPDGKDHWTEEIYQAKLKNMAKVISEIGADVTGTAPAIVGLCETENRKVLEDLVNQESLLGKEYGIVQFDSPDRRGIDVALIYQKKLFTPTNYRAHELLIYDNVDPTKRILKPKKKRENVGTKQLFNPMEEMFKNGLGTLAWRDGWNLFDQMIISAELTKKDYTSYRFYKAGIYNKSYLANSKGQYKGYPYRSFGNGSFTGGYSDHFPVFVYLVKEQ